MIKVGNFELIEAESVDERDPRGIIWVWEMPKRANYVIGCDPTVGIPGWHRMARTQEDVKTDNAVIEVIKCGNPDVQVAEFAAPIDPQELAGVLNFLGHMYAGLSDEGQCLACIEVYPGPGWITQNDLINKYGYLNLPPWRYEDGIQPKLSNKYGWYTSKNTRRDLWIKSTKLISERKEVIHSPWLIEEMADCTPDNFMSPSGRGLYGAHDDRVVANNIALWYAHEWSLDWGIPEDKKLETTPKGDWQSTAISSEDMADAWNTRFSELLED